MELTRREMIALTAGAAVTGLTACGANESSGGWNRGGLFYDCGGYLELGENAGLIPASVEAWLLSQSTREDTRHLVHSPSHPMGWTAANLIST